MATTDPIKEHRRITRKLALSLNRVEVFYWLLQNGYFPESYVLPPCFRVDKIPSKPTVYYKVKKNKYTPEVCELVKVHFPKTDLTDRTFGIIHPKIHNDISYHIARNWKKIVAAAIPKDSKVTSYSFPVPINKKAKGRIGHLRSGRMIYEFIEMTDDDLASVAYRYNYILKADIKNFFPSIYTHSISWAIHGKNVIRKPENRQNFNFFGNRLDKLFQNANDGCTNGLPIGPVVSDLISEVIASAVDVMLTKDIERDDIDCRAVRFKDDYRILVKSEEDAKRIIKSLQSSLKEYNLELNDDKTNIYPLPSGLFREWASKYHAVYPRKKAHFKWKEFRELYLSVVDIDKLIPGTGVIDRFLADIITEKGKLKVKIEKNNLQKVISMLLMLGRLRVKTYPKIIAIIESILKSSNGKKKHNEIVTYLCNYFTELSLDEQRNKYLISWISYFLVSNNLEGSIQAIPKFKDPITDSILSNTGKIFTNQKDFKLFKGSKTIAKKMTMLEHLEIFKPKSTL